MTGAQKFAAYVQAALAFITIGAVIGLAYLLLLRHIQLNDTLQALLNTAVGALIAWGGASISFWLARHRTQAQGDDTTTTTATITTPTTTAAPPAITITTPPPAVSESGAPSP